MVFSPAQLKALDEGRAVVVKIAEKVCVVLRKEVYEQEMKLLTPDDSDFDVREMEPLLADLASEDWEDASHYEKP